MVNNCRTTYSKLTSTSTLALHLSSKHKLRNEGSGAISGDPAQTTFSSDGARLLKHNIVDDDTRAEIFEAIVTWVVDDKQAFQVVEKEAFRAMCKKLNKFYTVPTRRTLVRGILDAYVRSIERIREVFDAIPG